MLISPTYVGINNNQNVDMMAVGKWTIPKKLCYLLFTQYKQTDINFNRFQSQIGLKQDMFLKFTAA